MPRRQRPLPSRIRNSLTISIYELDATLTGIEAWADTVALLA